MDENENEKTVQTEYEQIMQVLASMRNLMQSIKKDLSDFIDLRHEESTTSITESQLALAELAEMLADGSSTEEEVK
jgi:cell division septal protein FtsQ